MYNINKFNEHNSVSIFSQEIKELLPEDLSIVSSTGDWIFNKKDIMLNGDLIQISYHHNTYDKYDSHTEDGEPDYLEIDIHMVKRNDGTKSNPDNLVLNIDITYGDHMAYEFTIEKPNIVKVHYYTGKNSIYDPETFWGFKKNSLLSLVSFFNSFGYQTSIDNFKFIDDVPDSYQYTREIEKGSKLEPMIMKSDDMKNRVDSLKGGDKIKRYNQFTETIKVPIEVGDTILGGRFKNKKVVVKKIGKNAKGDITINDKPLLKFRIIKESFKEDVEINLAHLIDEGFIVNVEQSFSSLDDETSDNPNFNYMIRIWLPIDRSDNDYSYENSAEFNWSDVEDEIIRTIGYITEHNEIEYLYTIASKGQDGYGFKRTQWGINQLIDGDMNPGLIKCFIISVKSHPKLTSI